MSKASWTNARDQRREKVSELVTRGLTVEQITAAIADMGLRNPKRDEAWSYGTIHNDIKFLRQQWRDEALGNIGEHMGRQFAEIQAAKRAAWDKMDLRSLARFLEIEMKLLGTAQPDKLLIAPLSEEQAYAQMSTLLDKLESEVTEIDGHAYPTDDSED